MGLFRSRARKNREKAAAELPREQVSTVTVAAPVTAEAPVTAQAPVTAEAPVTAQAPVTAEAPVTAQAPVTVAAPVTVREMTAEERPDPDRPGWGRTLGQQIGRTREGRASQD
jgi:hypothetical protein